MADVARDIKDIHSISVRVSVAEGCHCEVVRGLGKGTCLAGTEHCSICLFELFHMYRLFEKLCVLRY